MRSDLRLSRTTSVAIWFWWPTTAQRTERARSLRNMHLGTTESATSCRIAGSAWFRTSPTRLGRSHPLLLPSSRGTTGGAIRRSSAKWSRSSRPVRFSRRAGLHDVCSVSGYSSAVGSHTVTAFAANNAGTSVVDATYNVSAWTLTGFYQPVDMGGVVNTVKNGSTVPLKFEVFAGPFGLNEQTTTAAIKSFTQQRISCDVSLGAEDAIETTAVGQTALRYDSTAG